ncbi:MAG TPA: hypothetical protein VF603_05950 [Allosphingosinicella sp.]|jgi:hypothetical protein
MKKQLLATAVACAAVAMIGTTPAVSAPKGNAYGYWAGRLCDHVGPTTSGTSYWQSRGYASRGACITAEGQSLARGEWDPDTLDPVTYPI